MIKALKHIYNFNSSRFRLFQENKKFAEGIPKGAIVLDAGAGSQPYSKFLTHTQYESADFEQVDKSYAKSTYVCDLADIPVENNRYDYILFNQVMEHLPEPKKVLKELNRVLKPGGHMIYTGPLFYEEHEQPYDFYRYTQFSLKLLFSETGFGIEKLEWMEGYYGAVGYQLNRMAKYLPLHPKDLGGGLLGVLMVPVMLLVKLNSGLFSVLFHRLEKRTKYTAKGYPKNYVALVTKTNG